MHFQRIKTWLFKPQDDMRPISWIIGIIMMFTVIAGAFFGPIIYIESYSGAMPINYLMGILVLCSGAAIITLVLWGHLMLVAIDVLFDICYLMRRYRSP